MNTVDKLLEIANYLNLADETRDLQILKERETSPNAEIIIPLVGEFSSGKTTLINALTDSKMLETATKPTTATIYQIRFGCQSNHAKVMNAEGEWIDVNNIGDLKNENLGDTMMVDIFDTSTKLPASTILVDTPGLSSSDPRHRQALMSFLPNADAVMLVTDVNQQITRSLTDFIDLMQLANKPLYLVITKSDTKSPEELENVKKYIQENIKLPLSNVITVSANKDDLGELYQLFGEIQKDKNKILSQSNQKHIASIEKLLLATISEVLQATTSRDDLTLAISKQENDLRMMESNIRLLMQDTREGVQDVRDNIVTLFENELPDRLDVIVQGGGQDMDNEVLTAVVGLQTLLFNKYKEDIYKKLVEKVSQRKETAEAVTLRSLDGLEFGKLALIGSDAIGLQKETGKYKVESGIDFIIDNLPIPSKWKVVIGPLKEKIGDLFGGLIDDFAGKPQRRRMIRKYIQDLIPEFTQNLNQISDELMEQIKTNLDAEASQFIGQKQKELESLKDEESTNQTNYQTRLATLKNYRDLLLKSK